jgi:hypothetical protein
VAGVGTPDDEANHISTGSEENPPSAGFAVEGGERSSGLTALSRRAAARAFFDPGAHAARHRT